MFRIVVVGKAAGALADGIAEFERRAARYWPLAVVEVRAVAARTRTADEVRREEGSRLLAQARGTIVALHEGGRSMSSTAFAEWMQARRELAEDVSFLVGGALGLSPDVLSRASLKLALAPGPRLAKPSRPPARRDRLKANCQKNGLIDKSIWAQLVLIPKSNDKKRRARIMLVSNSEEGLQRTHK
jgi:23S rRNA (pseudouridine1915-N3)-methyltransferase